MYSQPMPSLYHDTEADLVMCPKDKGAKGSDITD